jgi:magnesium chelatase family protein
LQGRARGESSSEIRKRVVVARALQTERLGDVARTNAELTSRELGRFATPDGAGARVMSEAVERLRLSTGDYRRMLRVARTIADLDGSDAVREPHVAEALQSMMLITGVA